MCIILRMQRLRSSLCLSTIQIFEWYMAKICPRAYVNQSVGWLVGRSVGWLVMADWLDSLSSCLFVCLLSHMTKCTCVWVHVAPCFYWVQIFFSCISSNLYWFTFTWSLLFLLMLCLKFLWCTGCFIKTLCDYIVISLCA